MKLKATSLCLFLIIGVIPVFTQSNEKIVINDDIQLLSLQDSVFIHISWHSSEDYGRFPSNGLIVVKNGEALMIDTPMDNEKTEQLTRFLKDSMNVKVSKLVVSHFHNDCLGGLEYLQRTGVESLANSLTIEKCKELNLPIPSISFTDSLNIDFNREIVDCRFFGAGHSFDNITVFIPDKKLLFGGCLVKSINSTGLGNLYDAVVEDWDSTIKKVLEKYPDIQTVVPGHGGHGGKELLTHTIEFVKNY